MTAIWSEEHSSMDWLTALFQRCAGLIHTHRNFSIQALVEAIQRDGRREEGEFFQLDPEQIVAALDAAWTSAVRLDVPTIRQDAQ